jgi:hypothetical protein
VLYRRRLLLSAGCLGWAGGARAHDFHAGLCDVQFNARSGSTEFVLSYPMHDVASAFWLLHGHHLDLAQAADEALLRADIGRQFALQSPTSNPLPLRWVGASSDTDALTVYLELVKARLSAGTRLRCTLWLQQFPDYSCTVNLRLGGPVRTLVFNRQSPVQRLV